MNYWKVLSWIGAAIVVIVLGVLVALDASTTEQQKQPATPSDTRNDSDGAAFRNLK